MVSPAQIGQMQMPLQQGQDPVEPVYNYTYGEARSKNMTQVMKSPAEQAAIDAALAKGPPQGYLDNLAAEELRLSSLLFGQQPQSAQDPYLVQDALARRKLEQEAKGIVSSPVAIRGGLSLEEAIARNKRQEEGLKDMGINLGDLYAQQGQSYGSLSQGVKQQQDPRTLVSSRPEPSSYNYTYDQAVVRRSNRDVKSPAENAAIMAAINAGPSAESQFGPQGLQLLPTPDGPIDPFARPTPGMLGPTTEINPIAEPPTSPQPDVTKPPMPTGGLAGLTQLPMFQDFATKLEAEHPEASQLFSQMFMGSSQRPMPYQNPFMGMGMGSFHPMMGMGMGGYNPMMGGMGGYNPMMGGMGMGGYSPFMGMNPFMGGGFNPMMGMGGGGLGSFYPQPSTYGPPQSMPSMGGYPTPPQSSPFGGAMRGYYA